MSALFVALIVVEYARASAVMECVLAQREEYYEMTRSLGPVAYWRLGEQSGTTANDYRLLYQGTHTNTPTLAAAGLITFDGDPCVSYDDTKTQYTSSPDATALRFGANWSGVSWIHDFGQSTTYNSILSKVDGDFQGYEWGSNNAGNARIALYASGVGAAVAGTTNIANSARHMVAVITDGTEYVYVDGVQDGTGNITTQTVDTASPPRLLIGARDLATPDNLFNGRIDEVAIFSRALSEEQIAWLYRKGAGQDVSAGDYTACCTP